MTEKERDIAVKYFKSFCADRILKDKFQYSLYSFLLGLFPLYYIYEYTVVLLSGKVISDSWKLIGYWIMFIICFLVFVYSLFQYLYYLNVFSTNKLIENLEKREVVLKKLNPALTNIRVVVTDSSGYVESADIANEFSSLFSSSDSTLSGYVFTYTYKDKIYRIAYPKQEFECALKYI